MCHTEFHLSFRLLNVRNIAPYPQMSPTDKILVHEVLVGASFLESKEPELGEGLTQFCSIKTKLRMLIVNWAWKCLN